MTPALAAADVAAPLTVWALNMPVSIPGDFSYLARVEEVTGLCGYHCQEQFHLFRVSLPKTPRLRLICPKSVLGSSLAKSADREGRVKARIIASFQVMSRRVRALDGPMSTPKSSTRDTSHVASYHG